jgi:hypothetical protein
MTFPNHQIEVEIRTGVEAGIGIHTDTDQEVEAGIGIHTDTDQEVENQKMKGRQLIHRVHFCHSYVNCTFVVSQILISGNKNHDHQRHRKELHLIRESFQVSWGRWQKVEFARMQKNRQGHSPTLSEFLPANLPLHLVSTLAQYWDMPLALFNQQTLYLLESIVKLIVE